MSIDETILDKAQKLLNNLKIETAKVRVYHERTGYKRTLVQKTVPLEWTGKEVVILPQDQFKQLVETVQELADKLKTLAECLIIGYKLREELEKKYCKTCLRLR